MGTYPVIEQLGTYDKLTNAHGEKLVSVNLDRISFWLAQDNVTISTGVREVLGELNLRSICSDVLVSLGII